jgi:hypothetical protein
MDDARRFQHRMHRKPRVRSDPREIPWNAHHAQAEPTELVVDE